MCHPGLDPSVRSAATTGPRQYPEDSHRQRPDVVGPAAANAAREIADTADDRFVREAPSA
jgi:hypothetical protein